MVSGIVGAGGNLGGMLFGFLFKSSTITYVQAFTYIGIAVMAVSVIVLITRFQKQTVSKEVEEPLVAVA
jgi:NNP family nitrate/nitrite transporter-like MFS transporter